METFFPLIYHEACASTSVEWTDMHSFFGWNVMTRSDIVHNGFGWRVWNLGETYFYLLNRRGYSRHLQFMFVSRSKTAQNTRRFFCTFFKFSHWIWNWLLNKKEPINLSCTGWDWLAAWLEGEEKIKPRPNRNPSWIIYVQTYQFYFILRQNHETEGRWLDRYLTERDPPVVPFHLLIQSLVPHYECCPTWWGVVRARGYFCLATLDSSPRWACRFDSWILVGVVAVHREFRDMRGLWWYR